MNDNTSNDKLTILTILRASFPFKGYVFGLIRQVVTLVSEFPKIRLQIIAFGEQENELQSEINNISSELRSHVEYIGRVSYERLADYFKVADLYIGMGTTVLDAANHGLPVLVVNSYTYESESLGYFSDNPTELAAMNGNTVPTDVFIRDFFHKTPEEREALGKASYEALKAHYSDKVFFEKLVELFNNSSNFELSLKEKIGIKLSFVYSFQFELGLFLRKKLLGQGYKVQFERNVSFFDISTKEMVKKEIDISIFNEDKSEKYAIELKYPTNGQIPERMYAFVKDVKFIEQLKKNHEFIKTVAVVLVDDKLFYKGRKESGIYRHFRNEYSIYGTISKPTGNGDEMITLNGKYDFQWVPLQGERKYYIIEI